MAEEVEVDVCPHCGADAVIIYDRVRNTLGKIDAETRVIVHCQNPNCSGDDEDEGR